jgi:hypothetical protein
VADYFVSIGDWFAVLDAGMGYEFGPTVESYRYITRYEAKHYKFGVSSNPSDKCSATPFTYRRFVLDRRVVEELYPPMYRVLPMVKLRNPSMKQFSLMLSALAGAFGRGNSAVVRY